jgi:hypothetical protein
VSPFVVQPKVPQVHEPGADDGQPGVAQQTRLSPPLHDPPAEWSATLQMHVELVTSWHTIPFGLVAPPSSLFAPPELPELDEPAPPLDVLVPPEPDDPSGVSEPPPALVAPAGRELDRSKPTRFRRSMRKSRRLFQERSS